MWDFLIIVTLCVLPKEKEMWPNGSEAGGTYKEGKILGFFQGQVENHVICCQIKS